MVFASLERAHDNPVIAIVYASKLEGLFMLQCFFCRALGKRSEEDGTFLLRRNFAENGFFILSFLINQMVYHVNVVQLSNGLLELGGVTIVLSDLSEMVEYFQTEPIYGHVKLTKGLGSWTDENPDAKQHKIK